MVMKRIRSWAKRPVIIPRGLIVAVNGLFVLLGIVLTWDGSPSLVDATSRSYLVPYGLGVALSACVALIGSTSDKTSFELTEGIGALLVFSLLTAYVAATVVPAVEGDLDKGALAVIVVIASILSATRGFSL